MDDARTTLLDKMRTALTGAPRGPVRRHPDLCDLPVREALIDLFVERVEECKGSVHRVPAGAVEATLAYLLCDRRTVVPYGFAWSVPHPVAPGGDLSEAEQDRIGAVVTTATLGVATTGTLVLTHAGQGRQALDLDPGLHVCVLHVSQVVLGVPEAVAMLDPRQARTWVSGPSPTGDIELEPVQGLHRARDLRVVLAQ